MRAHGAGRNAGSSVMQRRRRRSPCQPVGTGHVKYSDRLPAWRYKIVLYFSHRQAGSMSMSLRDQLLQAGLISQKQARDAEREAQRRSQPPPRHKRDAPKGPPGHANPAVPAAAAGAPPPAAAGPAAAGGGAPPRPGAKTARDQALNRQKEEKAKKKALAAQIKQLVEQNRVPPIESDDWYNFVDGTKIRRVAVDAAVRRALVAGRLTIVRHGGGYDLVPSAVAERIRERDAGAVVPRPAPLALAAAAATGTPSPTSESSPAEDPYAAFAVPDDLMW